MQDDVQMRIARYDEQMDAGVMNPSSDPAQEGQAQEERLDQQNSGPPPPYEAAMSPRV